MKITLKAARVNANLSLKDVSEALNVSSKTISSWERGITPISAISIKQLSELYNMPIDYIKIPM